MSLGSIYEPDDESTPRGRDLTTTVEIPRWALGEGPYTVEVPMDLPTASGTVRRAIAPGETGPQIQLSLPASVPEGATLRLRGVGEELAGGRPGDLYLQISLVDTARPPPSEARSPASTASGALPAVLLAIIVTALGVLGWLAVR